jgi:putative FmdB family regulatory protein
MPIYEYFCPKCKGKFEQMRPISRAEDESECPKCKTSSKRTMSKFVSHSKFDFGSLDHMSAPSNGSSCGSCSSGNCSSCGN